MASGYGLAYVTEMSWPMNVGGLPVFAWWPNLIIMFEMTMLGAITATVITLVVTALLPTKGRGFLYDPEVSDGQILVGVENPPQNAVSEFEKALTAPPGARVKTI
jgi:hypothetical protein